MEDTKIQICRLCLKVISDDSFEVLKETHKIHILYILPETNIVVSTNPVLCKICVNTLQESYNFKTACVEVESFLQEFIIPDRQLDLETVMSSETLRKVENEMGKLVHVKDKSMICRLCLTAIEVNSFKEFGIIEENLLQKCVPEMDLTLTEKPISCENCIEYLQSQFNFVMKCLDIDEAINDYLLSNNLQTCNLFEVLKLYTEKYSMEVASDEDDYYISEDKPKVYLQNVTDFADDGLETIKVEPDSEDYITNLSRKGTNVKNENKQFPFSSQNGVRASLATLYKCEHCIYSTSRKYYLHLHMLVHKNPEEIPMYKCPECSHVTKRKHNLLTHILKHKNPGDVRLHRCNECKYETRLSLEEEKAYKCDQCSYDTNQNYYLKKHMLIHKTPDELTMHKCELCDFVTKRKDKIKQHMNNMHNCSLCDYQTKDKEELNNHLKSHKLPGEIYK
ncbi:hypothetical protein NQ318_006941 [Aromia moschata]|uniref:Uncharacterized protein n=1 Tax=Aromia moschata TaxID=1265417 RepID=A0AAV8YMS3_9CUCU|nr:hypothetical protein NQ318_006941 [Aromia moschata]